MGLFIAFVVLAAIGLCCFAFVFAIRVMPQVKPEQVGALRDKVPYRKLIGDGIVQLDGGRLQIGWEIEGRDFVSMTYKKQAAEITSLASVIRQTVGADMSDAIQFDWDSFREITFGYPASSVVPPDPTSAVMYDARRAHFEVPGKQYVTQHFLFVTWTPPSALVKALTSLVNDGGEPAERGWTREIGSLQEFVDQLGTAIEDKWSPRRLTRRTVQGPSGEFESDELIDVLHRCFTHEDHAIALPDTAIVEDVFASKLDGFSLEGVVADQDVETRFRPRVGDNYFEVVQLETYERGGTSPNSLSAITDFPMPSRTSVRAILAPPERVEAAASRRFGMLKSQSDARPNKRRNLAAERKAHSAENVDSDDEKWWYWNVKVVVAGRTPAAAEAAAKAAKKMMTKAGFGSRIERLGNPSALAATWPGNNTEDRSESMIDTINLLDLAPTAALHRGPSAHPNPDPALQYNPPTIRAVGIGNTPVDVYDTVGDVAHLGSAGPIGSGKSTTSNGLIYSDRVTSPDMEHLILDQGYSAEPMVRAMGGSFTDMNPQDASTGICPFDRIEEESEREIWTAWVLMSLRTQPTFIVNEAREEHMRQAMRLLAKSPRRSMSLLQSKVGTFDSDMATALTPWTINGMAGHLFDVESDGSSVTDSKLQCYELSRVMSYRDDRITGSLATLIFNRLLRRQLNPSTRIRVHIDEPRDVFHNAVFAPQLAAYYDKIARKNNGGVRIFTQHLTQFLESDLAPSILSGTKTWLLQPNSEAIGSMKKLYMDSFQLSEEVCEMIAAAKPKRHLILWQNEHASLINPTWQPEELAWIGATGKRERTQIEQLRHAHPKTWQGRWYQQRGQHEAATRWYSTALAMGVITDEDISAAA